MPAALSADNTMGPGVLNFGDPNREGGASVIGQGLMGLGASLAGISNPEQAKALVAQQTVLQKAPGNKWTVAHVDPKTGQAILTNGQQFVTQNMFTPKADTVYQDEADKKRAQTDVERYNEMQAAGSKLDESLSKISDFKRAAENPNVKFGGAGGVVAAAKNIAYSLGIPVDGLDDTQTVQRVATQMQLDKGKLLPGSVSNYEDKLMGIANGLGLDKTRESNLTALDQQEAIIKHQKALHAEARKYAAEHNGMLDNGWFDHQAKWMQDNPLTFPEARKAAGASAPVAIEPGGAYVWTPQGMRKK
jgi:hypothetical protein